MRVGGYRFYFNDERWEWSPRGGTDPRATNPEQSPRQPRLVLSHKHPDDYEHVAATLDDIRRTHKPFSTRHRIISLQGATRDVVVIGERLHGNTGDVIGTQGFYIDVTPAGEAREADISQAVAKIAVIEQAKGALMYVYRVEAGAAFDVLKWRSQETNVKLRALAEQLLADIRTLKHDDSASYRAGFDRLLLTTDQRVRAKAARSHC